MEQTFKHLDLFSGIGGFAYACKAIFEDKYENVGFCDIDEFCHQVLRKNFGEDSKISNDICAFNGASLKEVDLITGGFPCQDISPAGISNGRKGLGGSRSGLYYEMLRIISEVEPKFIIYENSSLLINWIPQIHKNLTSLGYKNYGKIFTAREFGFPHKRARYYGISFANTYSFGLIEIQNEIEKHTESVKQKIFGSSERNKAEFNRTFSRALSSPSNSQFLRTFDGIPTRLDVSRIKALGNSIVPQIAMVCIAVIKELKEVEDGRN